MRAHEKAEGQSALERGGDLGGERVSEESVDSKAWMHELET